MSTWALLLLTPVWAFLVYAILATRDWPAIRASVREQPSALVGYTLAATAMVVTCPILQLLI